MIRYMVNIKTRVISLPDENGIDVFEVYLKQLGSNAKNSHKDRVNLAYLVKAINLMQYVDFNNLPSFSNRFYQVLEIEVDGVSYRQSFELIKPLHKPNIYELRINLRASNWRFRATFFPETYNGDKFYCFVYPFEKFPVSIDPTDFYRDKTFNIQYDVRNDPNKYVNYFK